MMVIALPLTEMTMKNITSLILSAFSHVLATLSLISGWIEMHRSQVRLAIAIMVLLLVTFSVFAPQLRMLAEDAGGGGH